MSTNTYRDKYIMVIATGFKFLRDTPDKIRGKIIDYVLFNENDEAMPIALQPYKDSIKLLRNHAKATALTLDYPTEEKIEVDKEFEDITEEDFINLYKEWKKRRDNKRESASTSDNG